MEFQVFRTFVLNLIYLIETLSNLIFNNGRIQWPAYKIPEKLVCSWLSQVLTGWLQHSPGACFFSALTQCSVLVPLLLLSTLF